MSNNSYKPLSITLGIIGVIAIAAFIISIIAEIGNNANKNSLDDVPNNMKSANGFGGTISDQTLEIKTTETGILKGESSNIISATDPNITSAQLTGLEILPGSVKETDKILSAIGKLSKIAKINTANGLSGSFDSDTNSFTLSTSLVSGVTKSNGNNALTIAAPQDITDHLITGYSSQFGVITATDSILSAINKLNGNSIKSRLWFSLINGVNTSFSVSGIASNVNFLPGSTSLLNFTFSSPTFTYTGTSNIRVNFNAVVVFSVIVGNLTDIYVGGFVVNGVPITGGSIVFISSQTRAITIMGQFELSPNANFTFQMENQNGDGTILRVIGGSISITEI